MTVSAADAAIVTATYTGTVGGGFSDTNYFGIGNVLDGSIFSLVFQYDTMIGADASPVFDQVYGGTLVWAPGHGITPMLSAVLTIGSVFFSFDATTYGQATTLDNGADSYVYHLAGFNLANQTYVGISEYQGTGSVLVDIDAPQEIDGGFVPSPFFALDQGDFRLDDGTSGSLKVDHVSITVATVPLPATLPLFAVALLGFGWVRRRSF